MRSETTGNSWAPFCIMRILQRLQTNTAGPSENQVTPTTIKSHTCFPQCVCQRYRIIRRTLSNEKLHPCKHTCFEYVNAQMYHSKLCTCTCSDVLCGRHPNTQLKVTALIFFRTTVHWTTECTTRRTFVFEH
ncbi:unnamed protein product [Pylaiella littoralis]